MVLFSQVADIPDGRPVVLPIPVAPVVECVILVIGVLIHIIGE